MKIDVETIKTILATYGVDKQQMQCIEECAELIQAINKYQRGCCDSHAVVEEIADVMIMCEQMALCFGYDAVGQAIKDKQERQKRRIKAEK